MFDLLDKWLVSCALLWSLWIVYKNFFKSPTMPCAGKTCGKKIFPLPKNQRLVLLGKKNR